MSEDREVLCRHAFCQQSSSTAGLKQVRALAREQVDQIGVVPASQLLDVAVPAQSGEQAAIRADILSAHGVERGGRPGDVDDVGPDRQLAVPEHLVEIVARVPDRGLGTAAARPVSRRLGREQHQDVQFVVVLRLHHPLCLVDAHRCLRGGEPRQTVGLHTHRTEGLLRVRRRARGVDHAAATVRVGADPEPGAARLAEPSHKSPILHRQDDALMARFQKAACPHHVAVAAIFEHAPLRHEQPAVGRRQLQPRRSRPDQVEIDLHGRRPHRRVELRGRGDRGSLRSRAQAQQALSLGVAHSDNQQADRSGHRRQGETRA